MIMDDDIVHDFLVEGGELLDLLDTQLISLEGRPQDRDLLNAAFRSFHTIKGGAGFLGLEALVAVSHQAEDLFDRLRHGTLAIDAELMDLLLRVLDVLRGMFDQLRAGHPPQSAPAELLTALAERVAGTQATDPMREIVEEMTATAPAAENADLITDDEFEALLDRLHGPSNVAASADTGAPGELITEDEFEALLDRLHGPGNEHAVVATATLPIVSGTSAPTATPAQREIPAKDTTVRVETETLDRIMNMVGELVLIRNRLTNLQSAIGNVAVSETVANLDVVTSDLQMAAMKTRMQPIRKVFGRFPRVVRDLARQLNKELNYETAGEDTELDKNLVEAISDPLIHLVRNAVDHGIEMPAERRAAGKAAAGTLRLTAEQAGDQIHLVISDDGKGIDAEALRCKVVEKKLMDVDAATRLSERECFELIFLPGFSTKEAISDISGRGVGMDVVKTRIAQLNGTIEIDSRLGLGTTIRIALPLTLAIMPTLMIVLGHQVFALPLVNVQEIINFERSQAREVDGRKTLVIRGRAVPLFYLSRWLVKGVHEFRENSGHVVIARVGGQSIGLLVDELIGQEEVVIKPLGALLHGTKGVSGATITGTGKIALILDLPSLLDAYAHR